MARRAAALLVLAWAWGWPASAHADVAPPNTVSCSQKKLHDPCATDEQAAGTCETSTCTRNDYSQGIPPRPVTVECLKCAPTSAKKTGCASAPGPELFAGLAGLWLIARRRPAERPWNPR